MNSMGNGKVHDVILDEASLRNNHQVLFDDTFKGLVQTHHPDREDAPDSYSYFYNSKEN